MFSQSLLFFRLYNPNSLSLSSQRRWSSSCTIFMALLCNCSSRSTSCTMDSRAECSSPGGFLPDKVEWLNHFPRPDSHASFYTTQETRGFLAHKCTLPVQFLSTRILKLFSAVPFSIHVFQSLYWHWRLSQARSRLCTWPCWISYCLHKLTPQACRGSTWWYSFLLANQPNQQVWCHPQTCLRVYSLPLCHWRRRQYWS